MGRLEGKVAIITGASTGVGPVMAARFVREGAQVLLAARREEMVLKAAAEAGDGAVGMRADVTKEADVAEMVDRAMQEFGRVDVLVSNAAAPGTDLWIWEETLDNWNATLAIDVTAAMLCSREVLNRSMLERGKGVIITVSSGAAFMFLPRKSHYVAAKAALVAFTQTLAGEVGPKGIRCNCLVPGSIDTQLWRDYVARTAKENNVDFETRRAQLLAGIPLQDISTPDDITNLALFLASDESRTITGQAIMCDAGQIMLG
jgi:3-oxoacyl-[acyl-carrier protein] reductase